MKAKKKVAKKKFPAKLSKIFGKKKRKITKKTTKINLDTETAVEIPSNVVEIPSNIEVGLERNVPVDISEDGLRNLLTKEFENVTVETLPAFMDVALNRPHDYGTICVAIGACAVAAAKAADRSEHGGITGFQAWAVFWEFVRGWAVFSEGPKRMIQYENLLYPQNETDFTTISSDTWEWVKTEAAKKIAEIGTKSEHGYTYSAAPQVLEHWQNIVESDTPPFRLKIKN